ncbi:MAG: FixH family protein [Gemmobacter sp.]|nr:FixH family protein [Gemmobacter sp.]
MRELTGGKVLAITVAFFGVIITVNLVMATQAIRTFPGIEVKNSYVASQTFDLERKAQEALGWTLTHDYTDGTLRLRFVDTATEFPSELDDLTVLVGRATESRDDQTPTFVREAGVYVAPLELTPGKWLLRVEAVAADGTVFRQRLDLVVKG